MKKILLPFIFLFGANLAWGQYTYNVNFFQNAGNPGGVNTENDAPGLTTWTNIILGPQAANVWSPVTPLPFAFDFYGVPVTSFQASQNGLVTFSTPAALLPNANENLPSVNLPDLTICGFWDEFSALPPTQSGDDIRINTFGTAPNRQFWIKWYSFEMGNPTVSFSYFAIVLEETTNKIYVVDQYSTTAAFLSGTVGVQQNNSTAVQFGANNIANAGNGTATTDNDYYEFIPVLLVNDDAGVVSLNNPPIPLVAGLQNVDVTIQNFGTNNLNSVDIAWSIDGVAQTPVNVASVITPGGTAGPITLGSYNFPVGTTNLKFWTTAPNGNADGNPVNDTLEIAACTSLAGTYTIGGATPDYVSIGEAVGFLESCGVSGPVTFNIAPGVYSEGVTINPILGASSTNTITFDGGSPNDVTVSLSAALPNGVFNLKGADYITITNMTIENTKLTDAWGVWLSDTAEYNSITNCVINMNMAGVTDVVGVAASAAADAEFTEGVTANYTLVANNIITGGDKSIHFEATTTVLGVGNQFLNNTLLMADESGIYLDDQDFVVISGNHISGLRTATLGDGIYCFDLMNFTITENNVIAPDYGIYVSDGNFDAVPTIRGSIVNNMAYSSGDFAFYIDDFNETDIFNNTGYGLPGIRIGGFLDIDIRNNIFGSDTDFAFESDESVALEVVDYNDYYVPATNTLFVKDGTTNYADLTSWYGAVPALNGSSVSVDPLFVATDDLHVLSPAVNDLGDNSVGVGIDIDGDTRPQAPSIFVDMGADEFTPKGNDVLISEVLTVAGGCGDSATEVVVIIFNQGTNTATSVPVTATVSGSLSTTLNATYSGSIPFASSDTLVVGSLNTIQGGSFDIEIVTQLPGDEDTGNDTVDYSIQRFPSVPPTATFAQVCEGDSTYLVAQSEGKIVWYDSLTGGNILAQTDTLFTSALAGNTTYYVGLGTVADSLETTYAAGNGCTGGSMFDITATSNIVIEAFNVSPNSTAGTTDSVKIWYIPNGTFAGNEINQAAWTYLGGVEIVSQGDGVILKVNVGATLPISAGATYAIYVQANVNYTTGAGFYSNSDLSITTGTGLCSVFGGTNAARSYNGTVFYQKPPCTDARTAITVAVDSLPVAAFSATSVEFDASFTSAALHADSVLFDFGDGATSADPNAIHTYNAPGDYTVCMLAYGICGIDTLCQTLTITCTPPEAAFGATSTELVATFSDSSMMADSIRYDFGDGTSSTDPNPTHTYAGPGDYTVCQIAYSKCEIDTVCQVLTITCTSPTAAFTLTQNGLDVTFTNVSSNADSVLYDFGDGNTSNASDPVHTYAASGVYNVCVVAYNFCTPDTTCQEISVIATGIEDIAGLSNLLIYPNPSKGTFRMEFSLNRTDEISAEITTIRGRAVYKKDFGTVNGSFGETIEVEGVAKGVYFLRLRVGNQIMTRKLMID
ncbi:MAG: PKD domain-containing protein [Bacteroidia bacterium]